MPLFQIFKKISINDRQFLHFFGKQRLQSEKVEILFFHVFSRFSKKERLCIKIFCQKGKKIDST